MVWGRIREGRRVGITNGNGKPGWERKNVKTKKTEKEDAGPQQTCQGDFWESRMKKRGKAHAARSGKTLSNLQ